MANLTVEKEVNALPSLSPKFRTDLFLNDECEEPWLKIGTDHVSRENIGRQYISFSQNMAESIILSL